MELLRAAIIGSGGMAHTRAAHLLAHERAAVVGVSSRNPVTGRSLAARCGVEFTEDWRRTIARDDVTAVFVATHNDSHAEMGAAALAAGKHLFVEYPLATSLEAADELISLAARAGKVLHVGHDQAFVGWHTGVKAAANSLGRLLAVSSILATPSRGGGRSVWRNRNLSGPPFMVGIAYVYHLVDIFGPVDWVDGTSTYEGLDEAGYYRSSVSTLSATFTGGGIAQLLYIRGFAVPRDEQEHAMMFHNGFLSYRGYVSGSRTNEGHLTRVTSAGPQRLDFPNVTLAQASRHNTQQFLREVLDGGPVEPAPSLAREAVAVALAAETAATEHRRVTVTRPSDGPVGGED